MKCSRQPKYLADKTVQITHVLEVRLAPLQWNRIKIATWQRRRTYSTITRYCVLKLARKTRLCWSKRMAAATDGVREGIEIAQSLHRHMMCLYGDDEKLIRLAAMDLGLTLSAFIRLAIELYLESLAMGYRNYRPITNTQLTWEGIRFTEQIQIFATNGGPWPFSRDVACHRFAIESYW